MRQVRSPKQLFLLIALVLAACQAPATPLPTATASPSPTPAPSPTRPSPTQTPDELAIRATREALNTAFALRDFTKLAKHLAYNASLAGPVLQAKDSGEIQTFFRSITNARPNLVLTFNPTQIQLNPNWGLASENGNWFEYWVENGDMTVLTGTYTAMWSKLDSDWYLKAEVFVPLTCTGSNYCNQ